MGRGCSKLSSTARSWTHLGNVSDKAQQHPLNPEPLAQLLHAKHLEPFPREGAVPPHEPHKLIHLQEDPTQ